MDKMVLDKMVKKFGIDSNSIEFNLY